MRLTFQRGPPGGPPGPPGLPGVPPGKVPMGGTGRIGWGGLTGGRCGGSTPMGGTGRAGGQQVLFQVGVHGLRQSQKR